MINEFYGGEFVGCSASGCNYPEGDCSGACMQIDEPVERPTEGVDNGGA